MSQARKTLRAILRGLFCCLILAKGLLFSIEQFWTHAHVDRFSSSNNGLLLPECDTDSTGLHCTSSRSDHAQKTFQMVALTWFDILVDSILGHASLLTFCKLKILVEDFYTHCRPRWDATVSKVKDNPHRHNLFPLYLFVYLIWCVMSQSTIFQSCWYDFRSSWVEQVLRCIKWVCSRIHWHSDTASGESWISILSISV